MFEIQSYASFVAAILVFQLVPGPGTLTILNATARGGIGAGFVAVAGILTGDFIYMLGSILGLATVMRAYPTAFEVLQWLGAGYLCWVGLELLLSPPDGSTSAPNFVRGRPAYFRRALAVGLTNPKVILFFVAFFPLFLQPEASPITLGVMMLHVTLLSFVYQCFLVLIGDMVARKLRSLPAVRNTANRLCGIALIGFGAKLAVNNR